MSKNLFSQKLKDIQAQLNPDSHLLLVSKTRSQDEIQTYYDLGQRDFGENRVQELAQKAQALNLSCPDIRWHMIGNLQSNKFNQLFSVPNLWALHSLADSSLLEKLIKAEDKLPHELKIFLQYNTSREEEKSGFESFEDLKAAAEMFPENSRVQLQGLMTMGTLRTENFESEARRCFQELSEISDKLGKELNLKLETSMGMSQDYKIALEESSNWIRLGTIMFK